VTECGTWSFADVTDDKGSNPMSYASDNVGREDGALPPAEPPVGRIEIYSVMEMA
jgi:hypothetical protein